MVWRLAQKHYLNQLCWNIVNWTLENKLRWILTEIQEMHLKMSSVKWLLFRLGLNKVNVLKSVLVQDSLVGMTSYVHSGCLFNTVENESKQLKPLRNIYYICYSISVFIVQLAGPNCVPIATVKNILRSSVEKHSVFQDKETVPLKEAESKKDSVANASPGPKRKISLSKRPPDETGHETILDLFRWPLILKYMVISALLW